MILVCAVRFRRAVWTQANYLTAVAIETGNAPDFTSSQVWPPDESTTNHTRSGSASLSASTDNTRRSGTNFSRAPYNATENGPTPPRDHPHAGARYPNGSWGYVVDVTRVRRWMLEQYSKDHLHLRDTVEARTGLNHSVAWTKNAHTLPSPPPRSYLPMTAGSEMETLCNVPPKLGSEKRAGWRLLANRIELEGGKNNHSSSESVPDSSQPVDGAIKETTQKERQSTPPMTPRSKLLCVVYTYEKKHAHVRAIAETWGWRCDGFFAASTQTIEDPTNAGYGAVDLPHEGLERYQNMWRKTRSIWAYIYDYFLSDFDYFYLSGDDTHVMVENLRRLLDDLPKPQAQEQPLYLGHFIPQQELKSGYFCGGGPGYVLNRQAVRILVQTLLPVCHVHTQASAEDRLVGECFDSVGIVGNHSVDAYGAQRFHGMHPNFIASYTGDSKPYFQTMYKFWGDLYGYKTGMDLVSNHSVSFHLIRSPEMMKRHHAIIYKSCPRGTILGDFFGR
jgi:hypothetical protein